MDNVDLEERQEEEETKRFAIPMDVARCRAPRARVDNMRSAADGQR